MLAFVGENQLRDSLELGVTLKLSYLRRRKPVAGWLEEYDDDNNRERNTYQKPLDVFPGDHCLGCLKWHILFFGATSSASHRAKSRFFGSHRSRHTRTNYSTARHLFTKATTTCHLAVKVQ